MKNRIAITLALAALAVAVLMSASIGQAASKSAPGGAWQDVAPLPQTLFGPATTTDGTYIYAFGGYHFPENIGSTLTTVYRYDPTANSWSSLADMPQPSLIASAVYYPPTNKIYLFGGATRTPDPVVLYNTTLIYDIASNTWSSGALMPAPRYQMAADYNAADGKIYLNGGFETSTIDSVQATTWKYDPVADSFSDLAPSPIAHAGMAAGIINGHFLAAGGRTNPDETLVSTWDYDIASDTWAQKGDMPQPTNVPGFAVTLGKLWAYGGCTPTPCNPFDGINNAESFDPAANS